MDTPHEANETTTRTRRRLPWVAVGVTTLLTAGLTIRSYRYSPSLTVCDVTVRLDEGLVAVDLPLTPIAKDATPKTQFLLYTRVGPLWKAGKAARLSTRNVFKVEEFADDSEFVAGFGYRSGGWMSNARPGPFVTLVAPQWAVAVVGSLAYLALRARLVRLRLWMWFVFTAGLALALLWLMRRATEDQAIFP